MQYKSAQALYRVCYDFPTNFLMWHCGPPYMVIVYCNAQLNQSESSMSQSSVKLFKFK